jgi:two-component system, NtrC family, response regulator
MPPGKILIIDDEEQLRKLMQRIISLEGFTVEEAGTLKEGEMKLAKLQPDVVLCDVKLPDGNGVDFVKKIKPPNPDTEIILLTAFGNIADGVQAIKNGAFDYITKGNDNDRIIPLLHRAMEKVQLRKRITQLEQQVGKKYSFNSIIGASAAIQKAVSLAKKVAATDTTVLLLGETGTGKEVFAQAIHNEGNRKLQSFVALNCSAFSKELLEGELFGHKAGAFTGAIKEQKGLIEEADNGTLFLDEIGEMPFDLQAKLLRVIETHEFIKLGDTKTTKANVRIIAATNANLEREIEEGKFRQDLYYRLNAFTITLPPLRERKEDILALADYYLHLFAPKTNPAVNAMDKHFSELLKQYEWKGNIRELKNVMERAVILAEGNALTKENLPLELQTAAASIAGDNWDLSAMEKKHIQKVLLFTKGNKTEAARLLNIGLTTLYRKIEEYKITT